jgi:hypothetical protein
MVGGDSKLEIYRKQMSKEEKWFSRLPNWLCQLSSWMRCTSTTKIEQDDQKHHTAASITASQSAMSAKIASFSCAAGRWGGAGGKCACSHACLAS